MSIRREFYQRDARIVARELLGQRLITLIDGERTSGRIIETEAYLGTGDAASHSHRGKSPRNATMFLTGGHAYVYLIYGMYWCFNVVTGDEGDGEAVLIRAIEPLEGIDAMLIRRGSIRSEVDVANGPGKLAIAMGIGHELNGADLVTDSRIWIERDERIADERMAATTRIGITRDAHHEWRYVIR